MMEDLFFNPSPSNKFKFLGILVEISRELRLNYPFCLLKLHFLDAVLLGSEKRKRQELYSPFLLYSELGYINLSSSHLLFGRGPHSSVSDFIPDLPGC
jgi:hypothetical protein